ncbi:MAG: 2-C-methyl-D-erythritol 4-phosphate cytidylyltransferase [bacterium]
MKDCSAVLVAAGSGKRLGFDKVLTPLAGKPVVQYSLETLQCAPSIQEIILVTRAELIGKLSELTKNSSIQTKVIEGGVERQDSVFIGIQQATADYVLIHDAARPLVTVDMIEKTLAEARKTGAAVCAQRATDTLKRAAPNGRVLETLNRAKIWHMQTPQIFRRELIARAYRRVQEKNLHVTDDAAAVELLGEPVQLVEANGLNLKITRETDWKLAELWLKQAHQYDT